MLRRILTAMAAATLAISTVLPAAAAAEPAVAPIAPQVVPENCDMHLTGITTIDAVGVIDRQKTGLGGEVNADGWGGGVNADGWGNILRLYGAVDQDTTDIDVTWTAKDFTFVPGSINTQVSPGAGLLVKSGYNVAVPGFTGTTITVTPTTVTLHIDSMPAKSSFSFNVSMERKAADKQPSPATVTMDSVMDGTLVHCANAISTPKYVTIDTPCEDTTVTLSTIMDADWPDYSNTGYVTKLQHGQNSVGEIQHFFLRGNDMVWRIPIAIPIAAKSITLTPIPGSGYTLGAPEIMAHTWVNRFMGTDYPYTDAGAKVVGDSIVATDVTPGEVFIVQWPATVTSGNPYDAFKMDATLTVVADRSAQACAPETIVETTKVVTPATCEAPFTTTVTTTVTTPYVYDAASNSWVKAQPSTDKQTVTVPATAEELAALKCATSPAPTTTVTTPGPTSTVTSTVPSTSSESTSTNEPKPLPATGSTAGTLALVASGLVVAGTGLAAAVRRRIK